MQRSSVDNTGKSYELMFSEFIRLFLSDSELSITKS